MVGMKTFLEKTVTITARGRMTVPKAVRQALGVDCGGKVAFRIEGGRVTLRNPTAEHHDPALGAYLALIEKDLAAGRNLRDLPNGLARAMKRVMGEVPFELDESKSLEGDSVL